MYGKTYKYISSAFFMLKQVGIHLSNLKEKQIPLWSWQILYLPGQTGIPILAQADLESA